jgi:hypothetical protein
MLPHLSSPMNISVMDPFSGVLLLRQLLSHAKEIDFFMACGGPNSVS